MNEGPARYVLTILKWAIPLLLLAFLVRSLSRIGWFAVWEARPRVLTFYLVPVVVFFLQPLSDWLIYTRLFRTRKLPLSILLRKQSLNTLIIDYSGDTYFFYWAQKNLGLKTSEVLHAIKDTNILSSGAGLVIIVGCALFLATMGNLQLPVLVSGGLVPIAISLLLPLILCVGLLAGGRRVTSLSPRKIGAIFAIFVARSLTFVLLGVLVWWLSGALPSLTVCFEFVTARLLFSRLPLPNKALMFASIAIAAAGPLNLSAPRIAAVLVIIALLQQVLAFVLVAIPWSHERLVTRGRLLTPLHLPQSDTDVPTL